MNVKLETARLAKRSKQQGPSISAGSSNMPQITTGQHINTPGSPLDGSTAEGGMEGLPAATEDLQLSSEEEEMDSVDDGDDDVDDDELIEHIFG